MDKPKPSRVAFITANPNLIPEILKRNDLPPHFHIYLVGSYYKHPKVSSLCNNGIYELVLSIICDCIRKSLTWHVCLDFPEEEKFDQLWSESYEVNRAYFFHPNWLQTQRNFYSNLLSIEELISFRDVFKNKPIVLVGAGPSLDKNIHILKQFQDNAIILACGSAIEALLKANIIPHLLIGLDAMDSLPYVIKPEFRATIEAKTILLYSLTSNSELVYSYKGRKILIPLEAERCMVKNLTNCLNFGNEYFKSGGTVTVSATDIAYYFGCNPIVFVGQDLCIEKQRYIDNFENTADDNPDSYVEMETIDGRKVKTVPSYQDTFNFLNNFTAEKKERVFINATEGGAGIKNALHITLKETTEKYFTDKINLNIPKNAVLFKPVLLQRGITEARRNLADLLVKTKGFRNKITAVTDETEAQRKIEMWMDSIRIYPGYFIYRDFVDRIWYTALSIDTYSIKMECLQRLESALESIVKSIDDQLSEPIQRGA